VAPDGKIKLVTNAQYGKGPKRFLFKQAVKIYWRWFALILVASFLFGAFIAFTVVTIMQHQVGGK